MAVTMSALFAYLKSLPSAERAYAYAFCQHHLNGCVAPLPGDLNAAVREEIEAEVRRRSVALGCA